MTFSIGIGPNLRKSAYFDMTVRDGVHSFSVYNHMLTNFDDTTRPLSVSVYGMDSAAQVTSILFV